MQNDKNICGYIGGIDIHSNDNKNKFAHLIGTTIKHVDNSSFDGIIFIEKTSIKIDNYIF